MLQRTKIAPDSARHPIRDVGDQGWTRAEHAVKLLRAELTSPLTRERAETIAASVGVSFRTIQRWRKRLQTSNQVTTLIKSAGFKAGRSRLPADRLKIVQEVIAKVIRQAQAVRMVDIVDEVEHRCRAVRIKAPARRSIDREMQRQAAHLIIRRANAEVVNVTPAPGNFIVKRPLDTRQWAYGLCSVLLRASVGDTDKKATEPKSRSLFTAENLRRRWLWTFLSKPAFDVLLERSANWPKSYVAQYWHELWPLYPQHMVDPRSTLLTNMRAEHSAWHAKRHLCVAQNSRVSDTN